jgi:hypothetical protein
MPTTTKLEAARAAIAAHTPGPWSIDAAGDIFAGRELIAIPCGFNYGNYRDADDGGKAEFDANARLIAAAPELLEALQEAHRALMYYEWFNNPKSGWATGDNVTLRGQMDAVIAKAVQS